MNGPVPENLGAHFDILTPEIPGQKRPLWCWHRDAEKSPLKALRASEPSINWTLLGL
jgi:hypothetical protein